MDEEVPAAFPLAHFGSAATALPDWRESEDADLDLDDDEELAGTPPDVVMMLGFDPKDMED